jgi:hypothetical protein
MKVSAISGLTGATVAGQVIDGEAECLAGLDVAW